MKPPNLKSKYGNGPVIENSYRPRGFANQLEMKTVWVILDLRTSPKFLRFFYIIRFLVSRTHREITPAQIDNDIRAYDQ
jgi:hypothetical protein